MTSVIGAAAMRMIRARRAVPLALLVAALPAAGTAAGPSVTTQVSDVRGVSLSSGGKTMVTYEVEHDFHARVEPFTALPGARIPRTDAFSGLWGEAGYVGAWLAPAGSFRFQFEPASRLVESAYFTNWLRDADEAVPLDAGDRFELAMGNLPWDAPLPADRVRGDADGALAWDPAVDVREVSARYGAESGEMEALFVRADVVARGGDVDARGGAASPPPLVIDLPRVYPKQTQGMYIVTVFYPYAQYVSGMTMRVLPAAGKAVLTANVRGYIPEAKEYRLPGGADIKEWHLPLTAVILLSDADDPVGAQGAVHGASGGVALVGGDGGATRRVELRPGDTLTAGTGLLTDVSGGAEPAVPESAPSAEMDEFRAANAVDRSLAAPVDLVQGNGHFSFTLDPDYRGQGVLALRSVVRGRSGTEFAGVIAVPSIVVDGTPMMLDRTRLVDLRVFPMYRWVGLQFTGAGAQTPLVKTRTLSGAAMRPGLVVDAVYDLGGERYAFVNLVGGPDPSLPPALVTRVTTISYTLQPVQALPVYYQELPAGAVTYDGEPRTHEFSAPLDLLGEHPSLSVGPRKLSASVLRTGVEGRATVLRAPGPLAPDPVPSADALLEGGPVAVVYEHPSTYPAGWNRSSVTRLELTADGEPPVATPKPIGTPCGTPQAGDVAAPDAPPPLDLVDAWLDADAANLYATIRLRAAPAPPLDGVHRWSFHWRQGNGGWFVRANLTAGGTWTFDHGGYNNGFFKTKDVTGEVQGELIRVRLPRAFVDYRDGELLQDTGAHSWVETQGRLATVDQAPQGADPTWGAGGGYRVGRCDP